MSIERSVLHYGCIVLRRNTPLYHSDESDVALLTTKQRTKKLQFAVKLGGLSKGKKASSDLGMHIQSLGVQWLIRLLSGLFP